MLYRRHAKSFFSVLLGLWIKTWYAKRQFDNQHNLLDSIQVNSVKLKLTFTFLPFKIFDIYYCIGQMKWQFMCVNELRWEKRAPRLCTKREARVQRKESAGSNENDTQFPAFLAFPSYFSTHDLSLRLTRTINYYDFFTFMILSSLSVILSFFKKNFIT